MANVAVANSSSNLSGDTLMTAENAETVTGLKTFDRDPSAPFAVSASSAKVDNLNADMVDGFHASDLGGADPTDTETITGVWTFTTNPVFNANAIPETAIADGSIFPRLAGTEIITGTWTFDVPPRVDAGGASSLKAKVGGVIYSSTTSVGNVGAGEDTLYSQAIAASVLGTDGDVIRIEAFGSISSNANNKVLRFKWDGSTFYTSPTATTSGNSWSLILYIARRGATSQTINGRFDARDVALGATIAGTGTATLSGAVTFAITGEATTNNDVTVEQVRIYWEPVA